MPGRNKTKCESKLQRATMRIDIVKIQIKCLCHLDRIFQLAFRRYFDVKCVLDFFVMMGLQQNNRKNKKYGAKQFFKEEGDMILFPLGTMVNKLYTSISLTGTTYWFGLVVVVLVLFQCMGLIYSLFSDVFLYQSPQTFVQAQLRDNRRAGDLQVEGKRKDWLNQYCF